MFHPFMSRLDNLKRFLQTDKEGKYMPKTIVSDEYIGGQFDRFATYYSDGSLRISDTTYVPNEQFPNRKDIELQNWEEVQRLTTYLNSLEPPKEAE